MCKRRSVTVFFVFFLALPLFADKVLIVQETGDATSLEAVEALTQLPIGSTVDVLSAAAVSTLAATPGGLGAYRAVILADTGCTGTVPVIPGNWGKDITGNVVLIGTDPTYPHLGDTMNGGDTLVRRAIDYVLADATKTGAYISLGCYFSGAAAGTLVPLLNDAFASTAGNFTIEGAGSFNDAHMTATHPALTGLDDNKLKNWSWSVHEVFNTWPADFTVLAIAKNIGSYVAPDGTTGAPYILARGNIEVVSDIKLTPGAAVNETGTSHTVTATISPAAAGIVVTFKVIAGPNVGLTGTAVTNAAGQATFTWASTTVGVDFIQAQFTRDGVTQTSNNARKEWVHTPKSCMRILQSKVLCQTDASGRPTGKYIWTFRVQNLSGTPAAHLFISGLTSPAKAVPDHLVFIPAVSGISPVQQVVLENVPPGPLTFMVSLHDSTLAQCCSTEVTLDLQKCECAQMTVEATPSCFSFPLWSVPPPYKYSFTIQNLSPILAEKVLVAAVSPFDLVTPVPTSQLQVMAAVNNIPPTGTGASAGPVKLSIGGPLAVGGQKVCLNISLNDRDIDDCCAITRCFTLPDCGPIDDSPFTPIGGGVVTRFDTGFRLTGLGNTGEDGVRIATDDATNVGMAWEPLDASAPAGAFVEIRASTGATEPGGRLRVTKGAAGYEISASIDGASAYRVEVYRDGVLAATTRHQPGITDVVMIWPVGAGAEIVHLGQESNHGDTLAFTLDVGAPVVWRLGDGTTVTGDSFRLSSDQPLAHDGLTIDSFELRAAGLREIAATGVSISVDCNGNGVADAEDIATGISLDQNGNGVPDECDGSADAIVLNTGYDDVSRTVLPGGSDDDDWRLVSPAPERLAKVIAPTFSGWPAALPDSAWISANASLGQSLPGIERLTFERCFCLAANADEVSFDLSLRADDRAIVTLNGQQLGAGGEFFAPEPLTIHESGAVGDGLFVAGTNCLRVEVIDSGAVVTGFTLTGTMTASGDGCASSHH